MIILFSFFINVKKKMFTCYGRIICVLFVKIIYGHKGGIEGKWRGIQR